MPNELGILFLHHDTGPVSRFHLGQIRRLNPNACVVTISGGVPFPGGYALRDMDDPYRLWRHTTRDGVPELAWLSADLMVFQWYLARREDCRRWVIVEWDTRCNIAFESCFKPVWNAPLVASNVYLHGRDDWIWFRDIRAIPKNFRRFAAGISPMSCILVADETLAAVARLTRDFPFGAINSELRFGTLARFAGYDPIPHPRLPGKVTWRSFPDDVTQSGVWHPVKEIIPAGTELTAQLAALGPCRSLAPARLLGAAGDTVPTQTVGPAVSPCPTLEKTSPMDVPMGHTRRPQGASHGESPPGKRLKSPCDRKPLRAFEPQDPDSAPVVVSHLVSLMQPRSVVHLGCSTGEWLSSFRDQGIEDVYGIDGPWVDPAMLRIPPERFLSCDLQQLPMLGRRFDLVLSAEVAEDFPSELRAPLVRSLVGLGDVVAFSAAVPLQGSVGHVHEKWPDYWVDLFRRHDYQAVDCLRPRIWDDERVWWWYRQSLILFVRDRYLAARPELAAAAERPGLPLRVVHPTLHRDVGNRARDLAEKLLLAQNRLAELEGVSPSAARLFRWVSRVAARLPSVKPLGKWLWRSARPRSL